MRSKNHLQVFAPCQDILSIAAPFRPLRGNLYRWKSDTALESFDGFNLYCQNYWRSHNIYSFCLSMLTNMGHPEMLNIMRYWCNRKKVTSKCFYLEMLCFLLSVIWSHFNLYNTVNVPLILKYRLFHFLGIKFLISYHQLSAVIFWSVECWENAMKRDIWGGVTAKSLASWSFIFKKSQSCSLPGVFSWTRYGKPVQV